MGGREALAWGGAPTSQSPLPQPSPHPLTSVGAGRQTLGSLAVVPNITLRKAIEEWRETHHKLIPRSAVELHEQIGAGSFKKVYRGSLRLPGASAATIVAVLVVQAGDVAAEAETLLRVGKHPRLVQFLGMCPAAEAGGGEAWLVVEFAALGELHAKLEEIEDTITSAHRLAMLEQICARMEALAAGGLIHRDLALRNVLVFGCARPRVAMGVCVRVCMGALCVA